MSMQQLQVTSGPTEHFVKFGRGVFTVRHSASEVYAVVVVCPSVCLSRLN